MYSFFALSGSLGARCAAAAIGSLIVTVILMAPTTPACIGSAFPTAIPQLATFTQGAFA